MCPHWTFWLIMALTLAPFVGFGIWVIIEAAIHEADLERRFP